VRARQIISESLLDATLDAIHRRLERPASGSGPKPASTRAPTRARAPEPAPATPWQPAPAARGTAEGSSPDSSELALYVYGVIAAEPEPTASVTGVDGAHPVITVREGDLAAVASHVAVEEFGEARLREHLADMGWVEATARAHEEVLDHTRAQVTVIPMRMCTVYRTEEGLREMLRREAVALREALSHLEGKVEVGVKVFADRVRAEAEAAQATVEEPEAGAPQAEAPGRGAAYLERRRRERDRVDAADRRLEEAAAEIHERLCAVAADGLVAPPQRPEASGHTGEMILNGVYLVEVDALEAFRTDVAELREAFAAAALELEMTGPWPAYNFVPGTIGAAW
jgi:hypothetical protein